MAIPANLKFDVRVRERLINDGVLAESEVQKHLEALPDLDAQVVELTIKQPALQNESDRDIVIVRTSGVRPPVMPVRPSDDDMPIIDDDDDDDDDLDLDPKKAEVKKPVEKAVEKPKVKDEDESEDEDEDEEEEKAPAAKDGEVVDKDWGEEP
jgi:hypothetical protein